MRILTQLLNFKTVILHMYEEVENSMAKLRRDMEDIFFKTPIVILGKNLMPGVKMHWIELIAC